jgi:hypothetical protein
VGATATELSVEGRHEVVAWFETHRATLPPIVQFFLVLHLGYLATESSGIERKLRAAIREIRRALGIVPSSERRTSGSPLAALPPLGKNAGENERERLELQAERSLRLTDSARVNDFETVTSEVY